MSYYYPIQFISLIKNYKQGLGREGKQQLIPINHTYRIIYSAILHNNKTIIIKKIVVNFLLLPNSTISNDNIY